MQSALFRLTFGAALALAALQTYSAPSSSTLAPKVGANYARPFDPPTRPAFLALPPGAVEPAGWLRDWCLAARDGFTGHLDDYDVEFKRAWAADHKMTGERLDWPKGGWPYEGGGYWFDGLARLGYVLHDDALIHQARQRLETVVTNMNNDGILFLWWLDRNKPEDRSGSVVSEAWPMWANGLLGRALSGYYQASGDQRVLHALETGYGGDRNWLRLGWAMSNPWPAFDTWTWTGNQEIAAGLSALFSDDGGGIQPGGNSWNRYRKPPDEKPGAEPNDHVVHFLESTTPWALGYLWTGNRRFLDTALAWHDLLEREAMQPSGVPVADEFYGPTGAFRGTETCDVAGYLWSQIALLTVSGQARLADRAERAFFNAGPVTVARDFKTHVYFQCPNRVVDNSPPHPHGPQAGGNSYKPKHYPLCCTAALNRIVPNFVMHMWMATYDNGLAATHYGPCRVSAKVGDGVPAEIICQTDYPFNDLIRITVKPARAARFPIALRIPGWCKRPVLTVNGATLRAAPDAKGFVRVERKWKAGDVVRLQLPMSPSLLTGRDRNAQGAPYAAVSYGPLLFALPIPESADANTPDPAAKWNYALDVQRPSLTVQRSPMPTRWDWPLDAPLKLKATAVGIAWDPDPKAPRLPVLPITGSPHPETLTLIPYGCTRFRISMFPVAAGPQVKTSAIRKILFLGNSITLHGPNEAIGWTGNWGMAASSEEKDYVHLVTRAIAHQTGSTPQTMVKNIAEFERSYATYDVEGQLKELFAFGPDLVVLAIGENVPELVSDEAKVQFKAAVMKILSCALAKRHPLIVVRSSFWANPAKDEILRQASREAGVLFVDASPIGREAANVAGSERSFTHPGVADHPGDRGMQALANAILKAILQRNETAR
jgi:hypothetical protein